MGEKEGKHREWVQKRKKERMRDIWERERERMEGKEERAGEFVFLSWRKYI